MQAEQPLHAISRPPDTAAWPAVPQHAPAQPAPAPAPVASSDITLPDLKTVLSPDFERRRCSPQSSARPGSPTSVRSLPRIDPGYHSMQERGTDVTMASPLESGSVMSVDDQGLRSTSVVSMEDPDVRIAAEALSGLGNPDFNRSTRIAHSSPNGIARASEIREDPEPLLELIAQAHPWVGGTIKTSLAAYSTTKYYSPRIVRYGASMMERNLVNPAVHGVNSVGELTGIDARVRRYLDSRRPGDLEAGVENGKDVRMENGHFERSRQGSLHEQLPPYAASRPPSYREEASPAARDRSNDMRPPHSRSWSSQLWVTTSGLSVALSHTSRNSIRYCLKLLRDSAMNVQHLSRALNLILAQYEEARAQQHRNDNAALEKGERSSTPEQNENARKLAESIEQHCTQIFQRLQFVINSVATYAGGALPDNARDFVRRQLVSLPQRWQIISSQPSPSSETSRRAQRMIMFASEGLEMMSQVSGVLGATLDSAEQWLARVGRSDNDLEMRENHQISEKS